MLGLALLYFIGRYFYRLAEKFNERKWLFAVLGVATYYAGTLIGGLILGVLDGIFDIGIDWDDNLLMTLIALPFGTAACCLFYFLLEKSWKKKAQEEKLSIESIGKTNDENE